jgi:ribosomal protein L29
MPKKTTESAAPKKTVKKAVAPKAETKTSNSLRDLRADHFSLKMKHALGELKEVHKLRKARKAIARHLTLLNNSK